MTISQSINAVQGTTTASVSGAGPQEVSGGDRKEGKSEGFSDLLEKAFDAVNDDLNTAGKMTQDMASGREVDIADTMIAVTKADISFRMMLQVRNKVLSAYEEVMRMQV